MKILAAIGVATVVTLGAVAADAQVQIETTRPQQEVPQPPAEPRIVPPPLHYEQTRPRDADYYPYGTRVEHDPAFIEPFAASYQTATGSGRHRAGRWRGAIDVAEMPEDLRMNVVTGCEGCG